jgi:hypothetical protein
MTPMAWTPTEMDSPASDLPSEQDPSLDEEGTALIMSAVIDQILGLEIYPR